jgi:three-Cys-motif partner protein
MGDIRARSWGYWTRAKLQILDGYLKGFSRATKKSSDRVYLDAFAGSGRGRDRLTDEEFPGSPRIALDVADPAFMRLRFFEMPGKAQELEAALVAEYPGRDISVVPGDCNETIPQELARLGELRSPTFAFLDPDGMELAWETLEKIARYKKYKTKIEMWILFPSSGVQRTLRLDRAPNDADGARATQLFGTDDWRRIHELRRADRLSGADAREGYVNLMRWQLQQGLGYEETHALEIKNLKGNPLYHMILATDHEAGGRIISSLYNSAAREIPKMREEALNHKRGTPTLFDASVYGGVQEQLYEYEAPLTPEDWLGDHAS